MLRRTILLGAVCALTLAAAASAQAPKDTPVAPSPDADGAQLVLKQCAGVCHAADRFAFQRHSPQEWRRIVLQMVSNGAQLFPDEIDTVTQYFATNLSDQSPSAGTK